MNPYLAVEVGWLRHPKVRKVHRDARSLWVAGGLHAVEHETDGMIEKHMVGLIAAEAEVKPSRAAELVAAGLWEDRGDSYAMHDFLEHGNPSKAQREEQREKWRKQKETQRRIHEESTADKDADTHTDSDTESTTLLSSALLSSKTPKVKTLDRLTSIAFDEFWACYPRKIGKPAARTAFIKALSKTDDVTAIGDGLRLWCDYWQTADQQFVPHPTTWLNREGWNDQPPSPAKPKGNAGLDYALAKLTNGQATAIETSER